MTNEFKSMIERMEGDMLASTSRLFLCGGAGDEGADPLFLDICSNAGICPNQVCLPDPDFFKCLSNLDACGPVNNPKLQLTCKRE